MTRKGRWRFGVRREVLILVPMALVLLVVVSLFTLASYSSAITLLVEQRRGEALRLARGLGQEVSRRASVSRAELRALAPRARGVAILDASGWPLVAVGDLPAGNLLDVGKEAWPPAETDLVGGRPPEPASFGPGEALPGLVVGLAPTALGGGVRFVRVDLSATILGSHRRSARILAVLAVGINGAVVLLVLLFLRHLLKPFEVLIDRARQVTPQEEPGTEDVTYLVSTLEKALAALGESQAAAVEGEGDDLATLERMLAANLESGLLVLDREGKLLSLNPTGEELLGLRPAPGTPLEEALGSQGDLYSTLAEVVEERQGVQRREIQWEREGEARTLGMTVHVLRRDDGSVRGYLALFADLTEAQKEAEEARLAESLAQLGELAGGIAHELRNSLATLRGYLTLIEREPEEENISDYLGEIRHETDHLQRVLEDFLSFARPGSIRPREVSLGAIVRRAMADPALNELAAVEGSDSAEPVVLTAAAPEARLMADEQLLERAVRNLLSNSIKAQREARRSEPVECRVEVGEEGPRLEVRDRGAGIPPSVRENLFQPFQAEFRGGVGLGLALTFRIVSLHGGSLRLEDRPGGGTRAVMAFPGDGSSRDSGERSTGAMGTDDLGPRGGK